MLFQKATKTDARLRLALIGPSGSGKTYTALALASNLAKRVALIDTERGSAAKYADVFDFDVLTLKDFNPQMFIDAIKAASDAGYEVVIIDSLSHAWMGKNGALELVDKASAQSKGNSFNAWKSVTPLQQALVDSILGANMHIIATMRSKTEYVVEQGPNGKSAPRKVGTAPVQRDGMEYEFDVVADLDADNNFIVTKTRCPHLQGQVFKQAGAEVAGILTEWLKGTPEPIASPEELEHYAQVRQAAIDAGFRTVRNELPKEIAEGATQKSVVAKTDALETWLNEKAAEEKEATQSAAADAVARDTKNETPVAPPPAEIAITDKQYQACLSLALSVNKRPLESHEWQEKYGKELEEFTKDEASYVLDKLNAEFAVCRPGNVDAPASAPRPDNCLTDGQHRAILSIANKVFGRPATAEDFTGLADKPVEDLTKGEASALIDRLRYQLAEKQTGGNPARATA